MPALTSLDLSGSQRTDSGLWSVSLTESGLATISTLKSLHHLRLNGIGISPRGLEQLNGLSKLDRLDLQSCARINDEAVPILKSFPALQIVDVSAAAVTPKGLKGATRRQTGLARHCQRIHPHEARHAQRSGELKQIKSPPW